MKEVLYIQAGAVANHIGTHFWNAQESYFTYDEDSESIMDHDVSFREGLSPKKEPTFCPRLLVFDQKANFGTISQSNALFDSVDGDTESPPLWNGDTVECRQDPITKSEYQERMDVDLEEDLYQASDSEIRYWSDFNRVYYIPRTIQRLPDSADWDNAEGNWNSGKELFTRYNEETNLMDESLRLFVEECDLLQGIQITNDTTTFGSFIDSFLTCFRDEFLKLSSITFPLLSDAIPGRIGLNNARDLRNAVNDALCLRSLDELSAMNVPIQSPSTWEDGLFGRDLLFDRQKLYHTSSILSAHIETVTFPLRLKEGQGDLSSFCSQLDWRGSTRFGQLSGIFPITSSSTHFDEYLYGFSVDGADKSTTQFSRRDVSRGFSRSDITSYENWCNRLSLKEPFLSSVHAPTYPLPSSFPSIFKPTPVSSPPSTDRKGVLATPIRMFSSVSTGTQTSPLFERYAYFIEDCVKRKPNVMAGVDKDELKELGNDLWVLRDKFAEGDTGE